MTESESLEILKRYDVYPGNLTKALYLRDGGEKVGEIDSNFVWIVKYLPSAIGSTYFYVRKIPVSYDSPRAHIVLETLLQDLSTSAQRYEQSLRDEKIKKVQQYFKERELKKLRYNELIKSYRSGEHLSREELRELSAMGYTL